MNIKRPKKPVWIWLGLSIALVVGAYIGLMLWLPVPDLQLVMEYRSGQVDTGQSAEIAWPNSGGSAIGAVGYGVTAKGGSDKAMPTASVAKVIMAMSVLRQKPIASGQTGSVIVLDSRDEGYYNVEIARNGSAVPVNAGQKLTEYDALQILLLPSANNMARTLADWAFGSEKAYISYANSMLADMGLTKTHVADSSGYSPATVSSPAELVQIGIEALKDPTISEIVAKTSVSLPGFGLIENTNRDLGWAGIDGIKTGHSDEAGGCLLFSALRNVSGENIRIVGAVQSLPHLDAALAVAGRFVETEAGNFVRLDTLPAGHKVGEVRAAWGVRSSIVVDQSTAQVVRKGSQLTMHVSAVPKWSGRVGKVQIGNKTTDLVMKNSIPYPSSIWRLTHPRQMLRIR